jgi:dTDP-glucose 4,6-dehydratase
MTERKTILVTGGLGFIGSNLIPELKSRGHEVWVCDLGQSSGSDYIRCDVTKYRQLERLFDQHHFDYVYHLAAEYGRWNGEDYYENLWLTNVVGELQVLNSAAMFGTETVRVRPVNAYGPHEHYSPYRGVIPAFIYKALRDEPYTVYMGHKRIFDYIEDTCRTFANIVDHFKPGEVYNVGSKEEWEHDIKYVSDLILKNLGKSDAKVTYKKAEAFTTRVKHMDFSKIRRDLNHSPKVPLEEGIPKTIQWMKGVYGSR